MNRDIERLMMVNPIVRNTMNLPDMTYQQKLEIVVVALCEQSETMKYIIVDKEQAVKFRSPPSNPVRFGFDETHKFGSVWEDVPPLLSPRGKDDEQN